MPSARPPLKELAFSDLAKNALLGDFYIYFSHDLSVAFFVVVVVVDLPANFTKLIPASMS